MLSEPLPDTTTQEHKETPQAPEGLFYELKGNPNGKPLLLIHGYTVRGDMFYPAVPYYKENFRCILPDIRGAARSGAMPGPHTVQQYAADMVALLDALGIDQANIMGYSMGGIVAQTIALNYPERVSKLVLACTWAYKNQSIYEAALEHVVPWGLRAIGVKRLASFMSPTVGGTLGVSDHRITTWYREVLASNLDERMIDMGNEIYSFDSRSRLGEIKAPTLVLGAANDVVVPVYHAKMLAKGIPGAQYRQFSNASHALIFTHSQAFGEATRDFLES